MGLVFVPKTFQALLLQPPPTGIVSGLALANDSVMGTGLVGNNHVCSMNARAICHQSTVDNSKQRNTTIGSFRKHRFA
jgi:hypothetical protein